MFLESRCHTYFLLSHVGTCGVSHYVFCWHTKSVPQTPEMCLQDKVYFIFRILTIRIELLFSRWHVVTQNDPQGK